MQAAGRKPDDKPSNFDKWTDYEMQFEEYALNQPHTIPFPPKKPRGQVH
jgi:hypothetical protein